jgi:hypothetical protein
VRGDGRAEMMICGRDERLLAFAVSINMFPFLIKDLIRDVMNGNRQSMSEKKKKKNEANVGRQNGSGCHFLLRISSRQMSPIDVERLDENTSCYSFVSVVETVHV